MRPRLLSFGILLATTACGLSNTTNPYDPNAPVQTQARATLVGSVTVEPPETGTADASGVIVSLEGANVTARTGPTGSFTLVEVPAGTYVMSLSKPGYDTVTTVPIDVPLWDSAEPNVNVGSFSLALSRGSISGTATLEGETGGGGITVTVQGTTHVAITNGTGAYLISSVPIGTYTLTFQKTAFKDTTLPSVVVADNAVTTVPAVTIASDPGSIAGQVVLTGQPDPSGVMVIAQGTTLDGQPNTAQATTDQTGTFSMPTVAAGVYDVTFQTSGFLSQQVATAVSPEVSVELATVTLVRASGQIVGVGHLDGAMSNAGILVVLTPAQSITPDGGALDDGGTADAGAADAGGDAGALDAGSTDAGSPDDGGTADSGCPSPQGAIVGTVLTVADGTYQFQSVPVGEYTLTFTSDGYHCASVTGLEVTKEMTTTVPTTVLTSQPAAIQGQVLLEDRLGGGDMSGTQVAIQGTTTVSVTAPDGTFVLSNVGIGAHIVAMSRTGYVQNNVFISTTPGEQVDLPQVTLPVARGSVGGTMMAEELTDYSGIQVSLAGGVAGDSYSALTDSTGAFLLSNVRVGTYSLVASLANYQLYTSPTFQVAAEQTAQYAATPAQLTLLRISGLSGVVTAGAGAAQDGTTVLLSGSDVNNVTVTQSTITQMDGSYALTQLPPGSYALAFTHPGYNSAALPPTSLSAGQMVTLPGVSLSVAEGGLIGTILLAEQTDSSGTLVSLNTGPTTITGTDGSFSFPGLASGTYNITASHAAYVTTTLPPQAVPANGTATAPSTTLAIDTSGSVAGSVALEGVMTYDGVTASLTGADANGVTVTLSAVSAASGAYNITGVPAGTFSVTLSKAGFANQRIDGLTLVAGQMITAPTVTLAVSRGNVSGVILAAGLTDSSGTVVGVDGTALSAVTGPDGSFSIGGLAVGSYTLTATRTGFNSYTSPTFTMMLDGALTVPAMPVTLTLAANATIMGQVSLETGASPLGVVASLAGTLITGTAITTQTTTVAANGSFSFNGVSPGTYAVSLAETGFVTSTLPAVTVAAGATVTLAPFVLPVARGTITGTITAAGAASNSGCLVQLANTSFVALTSGSGAFSMSGVPGGSYTGIASRAGYVSASTPVTLAPGGSFAFPTTTLLLDITATISGTCTAMSATSLSGSNISLAGSDINGASVTDTATTAADGTYTLRSLPAGTYVVTCSRLGFGSTSSGQMTLNAAQQYTGVGLSLAGPTGNVSGTVALSAGVIPAFTPESDLSGITVVLSGPSTDLPQALVAVTNTAGAFTFISAPVSQSGSAYSLRVAKPGYAPATGAVTVQLAQTVTASAMTMTALPSNLAGTVTVPPPATSASGFTPVLTGTAFNGTSYGPRSADGPTGMSGGYQFSNVPAGNYTVSLTAAAYNAASGTVSVPYPVMGVPTVAGPTLALNRATGALAGQVVTNANGSGLTVSGDLGGITVSVTGTGLPSGLVTTTDSNGNWSLTSIAVGTSGTYTITASRSGYASATTTATVSAGITTSAAQLTLLANIYGLAGTLTVTGGADNSGVAGALAGTAFNGMSFSKSADTTSTAAGAITFSAVPAGTYTVTFTKNASYSPLVLSPVVVAAPPAMLPSLSGTLQRAIGSFSGTVVTSAGSTGMTLLPIDASGATVGVTDPSLSATLTAVTSSSGNYTIANVPAPVTVGATYTVSASKPDFSTATTTAALTAGSLASPVSQLTISPIISTVGGCVIVPAPAADSTGVVATIAGVAFNGTTFTKNAVGPSSGTMCGGATGASYSFSNVPNGTYTIALTRTGYGAASVPGVVVAGSAITVNPATLGRSTGAITGTVLASDGGAGLMVSPAAALVSLTGADLLGNVYQASVNSAGAYTFTGIPVSPSGAAYTITVTQTNFTSSGSTTVIVPTGSSIAASNITLTLNNGSVAGSVSVPAPAVNPAGVSASLSGTAFTSAAWTSPTLTTGATGTFSFATVPPGTYTLTLTLAGMSPLQVPTLAVAAGTATTVPAQTMARATGALSGQVAWNAGGTGLTQGSADLQGVNITVTGSGLAASYGATTDVNGNWTLASIPAPLTTGVTYTVTASKPGFTTTSTTQAVVAGTTSTVGTLTMAVSSFNLSGTVTVTGAADNSGVTATLAGIAFNGTTYSKNSSSPSNAAGAFSITAVPAGTYSVTLAGNASYAPLTISNVLVAAPPATLPTLTGTLQRATGSFSGTVATSAGSTGMTLLGTDASGATVGVTDPSLMATLTAQTSSSGSYTISNVPAPITVGATYTISASKPNFGTAGTTAVLTPGTAASAVSPLTLSPVASTVSGCVIVPAPAPNSTGVAATLTGVAFNGTTYTVNAAAPSSGTACGGQAGAAYSLSSVPNGTYTISLTRTGYGAASVPGVVVAGSAVTVATATLGRSTGAITGTVLASDGGAGLAVSPASALVSLTGADLLGAVYQATTNSAGAYSFAGIPVSPTGAAYTITVTQPNFTASGTTTVVVPGGSSIAASSITLTLNNGSVTSSVTVPSPPAANSAGVSASLAGTAFTGAEWTSPTVVTGAAGGLSFATVPPGTYTLTLTLGGMNAVQVPSIAVTAGVGTTVPGQTMSRATGGLSGQVAWNANGTGLTQGASDLLGVSITVTGTGLSASYGASTDASGNWTVQSIPAPLTGGVTYTVTASKVGFATTSTTQSVVAGTTSPVSALTMNVASFNLSGTVAVTGAADNSGVTATLAGVAFNGTTYSKNSSSPSNASGAFSVTAVPAGTFSVTLTGNASYAPLTIPNVIVAAPPATLPALNGTLTRALGGFSGSLAVASGSSGVTVSSPANAAGATVTVTDPSFGGVSYFGIANGSGVFTVTGIPAPTVPGGAYTITVSEPGFTNAVVSNSTTVLNPAVPLTSVGTITLTASSFSVGGTVTVTSPATSASGTVVTLSGTAFNGMPFMATATGSASGLAYPYSFGAVPVSSGIYTITATAPGFVAGTVQTAVTSNNVTGLNLTLGTRSTGSVTGQVTVGAGGTGLTITGAEKQGILVTLTGGGLSPGPTTTTDSTGSFTLQNIPTTISGPYSVNVSKDTNWLAGSAASVTVNAGATATATGLSLTVNPGNLPVVVQLHDFVNNGNPATFAGVPVSLSGIAFNGASVGPTGLSSSSINGTLSFGALPPGSYTVTATLAQHTSATSSGIAVPPGGAPSTVILTLSDTAAPSAPIIAATNTSPTSSLSTSVSIVQASVDPTSPAQNFDDYVVQVYSVPNPATASPATTGPAVNWSGVAPLAVALLVGNDNYIKVYATDWNNNESTVAQLMIHAETTAPPAPTNVHVDNQPGSVRITWTAPTGDTSSLPVAGYKVYYGPQLSTSGASYTGTSASQGPSPIIVGNVTDFNLTGLSNNNAFYIAVTAYDTVTPTPNESVLSSGYLANPNTAPFDRAVHQGVGQFANSVAVLKDDVLVSTGTGPSANVPSTASLQALTGPFKITAYSYQQYGGLVTHPTTVSSTRGRKLVADTNRVVYAFDPGDPNWGITAQSGLDIIDAGNLAVGPVLATSNETGFSTYFIDHIIPAHRAGNGTTHGFVTYKTATNFYIQSFFQSSNHVDIALDANQTVLHTFFQPYDVQVAFPYVFVLNQYSIDVYTVTASATAFSIAYTTQIATSQGYPGRTMAVNWPIIYYTDGGTSGSSTSTGDNTILSKCYVSSLSPFTLTALALPPTLAGQADKLVIAGDLLLAQESPGWNTTAVESFNLANPYYPVLNGNYDLNVGGEIGYIANAYGMGATGSSVYVLNQSSYFSSSLPYYYSTLDVVEMGGPRSIVRQNGFIGLSGDAAPGELFDVLGVQIHGTRAIGLAADNSSSLTHVSGNPTPGYVLINADMVGLFGDTTTDYFVSTAIATPENNYPPNSEGGTWCQTGVCIPFTVYGDYAFVDVETNSHAIYVYDVSIPTSGITQIATYTPTTYPTAFAAANDYLYVTESNTSNFTPTWLQRFDLTGLNQNTTLTATPPTTPAPSAFAIDIYGDYAYVGITGGFCVVNLTAFTMSTPVCYTPSTLPTNQPIIGISVDAERLIYTTATGTGSTSATVVNLSAPTTVVASYGAPASPSTETSVGFFFTGPNLFQSSVNISSTTAAASALAGYDTSSGSLLPLDTDPFIRSASEGAIGRAGSLIVVPDQNGGMVMERIY